MQLLRNRPFALVCLLSMVAVATVVIACSSSGDNASATPTHSTAATSTGALSTAAATGTSTVSACPPSGAATKLSADGSTFVQPLFSDWFTRYDTLCSIQVNYQSTGSGQGITDLSNKNVDFADSDAIMTDAQKTAATGGTVAHIPMTSDAVAVIYNVEGVANLGITLDGATLANIFLGKITKWNDPAIKALNTAATLPDEDIVVVYRSDGSGTTNIFTNYLDKVSTDWHSSVGTANSVQWPAGIGESGSAAVAGQVQQQPGSIGYVSLAYAVKNNISYAKLINSSGNAIEPSIASSRAAQTGLTLPDNMQIVITNSPNADAYPISGFTWALVYTTQTDKAKAETIGHLLHWMLTDAQQYAEADSFVPLSDAAQQKALAELATVMYQGTPVLNVN
ncbi:MAG TPA: phosphate ABC transporter substrate-binding protein PstS [Dehalococcoidia bacterium]